MRNIQQTMFGLFVLCCIVVVLCIGMLIFNALHYFMGPYIVIIPLVLCMSWLIGGIFNVPTFTNDDSMWR